MPSTEIKTTHAIYDRARNVPSERIKKMIEIVTERFNRNTGELEDVYSTRSFYKFDPKELAKRTCFDTKTTVFLKLTVIMQKSNNEISGTYDSIARKIGLQPHATRSAIQELLKADVLRRLGQSRYMINPAIICCVDGRKRTYLDSDYQRLPLYATKK